MLQDIAIAVSLLILLSAGLEAGFRFGRRKATTGDTQIGAIQGALLGLLGLFLSFTFAGAAERFLERQDLILQEANAIGTAFLRADMLAEPHRSQLRDHLARYTAHRLEVSRTLRGELQAKEHAAIAAFHQQIWQTASAGVTDRPEAMLAVLMPVNDVLDLHASRIAAGRKHLPLPVVALLIICSVIALAVIGYGCGLARQRHLLMTGALVILVGASLWTTIDLDHPRAGLIRLSDAPLRELDLRRPP